MKPRCFQWEEIACNSGGRYRVADAHTQKTVCSGCGSVGRAVDYYTRDPQFESSQWQILY